MNWLKKKLGGTDNLWKWVCIILAGGFTFVSGIFDTREKDRISRAAIEETVEKKVSKLLESKE